MPPEPSAIFAWCAWNPAPLGVRGGVKEAGQARLLVGVDAIASSATTRSAAATGAR